MSSVRLVNRVLAVAVDFIVWVVVFVEISVMCIMFTHASQFLFLTSGRVDFSSPVLLQTIQLVDSFSGRHSTFIDPIPL